MEAQDIPFANISVGDSASFERLISEEDIADFSKLSGDANPLHVDAAYAATTSFKRPIVHGMFLGALCSRLVGMHLPGKRCLYLSQSLVFKKPVYAGETVVVRGQVTAKSGSTKILDISIIVSREGETAAEGTAKVQVLE